ncbi:MAG TPA: hypothetical protein VJM34_06200 [Novosphingobium sp.]|nr:hypothetical protein [Novosphingobium sp.]
MSDQGYGFAYTRGLDLTDASKTTDEEKAEFWAEKMAWRPGKMAYPLTAYSFLIENRPDMLKYHLRQMQFLHAVPANGEIPMGITMLTMLHWYACNRVPGGVLHEVMGSQEMGATKAQVNEIFGLAFMHSGPCGFNEVYLQAFDYMTSYREPERAMNWPKGWEPDPEAFRTGLDFDNPELTAKEHDLLNAWYDRTIGYVPKSIATLVKYNPSFVKQHRAKFEGALATGALPKQMVPYILIHYNMNRGFRDGIREATLLGKHWGMTRDHVVNALTLGTGYMAGMDGMYIVEEAIGDLLESWD